VITMGHILNEFGLSSREMNEVFRILRAYPQITLVHVFGSRAKGTFHKGSDIDLAIMNGDVDPKIVDQLNADFNESSLPFTVDLVQYHKLTNDSLKDHIDRVGKVFYQTQLA
jgi:predicted nucleotidyltransferase